MDIEVSALEKMELLSVSDNDRKDSENLHMEIDVEKKRKREESLPMKKIVTTDITPAKKSLDPKFRDLPNIIKPLVEEKSMEFFVKGDGPCFIRTTGAHIFGDEDEAPQLARDLNTH